MSKKTITISPYIVLSILAIIAIIGFVVVSSNSPKSSTIAQETSDGNLSLSETSWNIGNVSMKDGIHIKTIVMENTSSDAITITQMETSCMCTKATIVHEDGTRGPTKGMPGHGGSPALSETIAPGERASIQIAYDPNAHGPDAVGPIRRSIQLKTTNSTQPVIKLNFSGMVTK